LDKELSHQVSNEFYSSLKTSELDEKLSHQVSNE